MLFSFKLKCICEQKGGENIVMLEGAIWRLMLRKLNLFHHSSLVFGVRMCDNNNAIIIKFTQCVHKRLPFYPSADYALILWSSFFFFFRRNSFQHCARLPYNKKMFFNRHEDVDDIIYQVTREGNFFKNKYVKLILWKTLCKLSSLALFLNFSLITIKVKKIKTICESFSVLIVL